jgi:chemotaxis protein CheX
MTITQSRLPILSPAGAASRIEWSGLIVEAAQEVFEIMVGAKLTPADVGDQRRAGVTAMLGFAGAPCGVLSVRCPWDAAAAIAARMLGSTSQELSSGEVCDALGEICNMVAGSIKSRLPNAGEGCMMSIPTVVRGVDYEVRCLACNCCFSIIMEFDGQAVIFHLELQS